MANSDPSQIQLIDDQPSPRDDFHGGAHDRVATALVNIIGSGTGGRAIGLEGSWGSGKSSVIAMAKEKLAHSDQTSDTKHVVFVFDAWARGASSGMPAGTFASAAPGSTVSPSDPTGCSSRII